jgi:hypothetical protein
MNEPSLKRTLFNIGILGPILGAICASFEMMLAGKSADLMDGVYRVAVSSMLSVLCALPASLPLAFGVFILLGFFGDKLKGMALVISTAIVGGVAGFVFLAVPRFVGYNGNVLWIVAPIIGAVCALLSFPRSRH